MKIRARVGAAPQRAILHQLAPAHGAACDGIQHWGTLRLQRWDTVRALGGRTPVPKPCQEQEGGAPALWSPQPRATPARPPSPFRRKRPWAWAGRKCCLISQHIPSLYGERRRLLAQAGEDPAQVPACPTCQDTYGTCFLGTFLPREMLQRGVPEPHGDTVRDAEPKDLLSLRSPCPLAAALSLAQPLRPPWAKVKCPGMC